MQPAFQRADDHAAIGEFLHGEQRIIRTRRNCAEVGRPGARTPVPHAVAMHQPQPAARARCRREQRPLRGSAWRRPRFEHAFAQERQRAVAQEPERALPIAEERGRGVGLARLRHRKRAAIAQPQNQAGGMQQPHVARRVCFDGAHRSARPTGGQRHGVPLPVAALREITGILADPQGPARIFAEAADARAAQRRRIARIEDREAQAIEPGKPVERADPQVSRARLQQCGHGILRQPLLRLPRADQPVICWRKLRADRRRSEQAQREEAGGKRAEESERHVRNPAPALARRPASRRACSVHEPSRVSRKRRLARWANCAGSSSMTVTVSVSPFASSAVCQTAP